MWRVWNISAWCNSQSLLDTFIISDYQALHDFIFACHAKCSLHAAPSFLFSDFSFLKICRVLAHVSILKSLWDWMPHPCQPTLHVLSCVPFFHSPFLFLFFYNWYNLITYYVPGSLYRIKDKILTKMIHRLCSPIAF